MSDNVRPVTIEDEWPDDVWGGQVADVVENDRPTHVLMPWDAWVEKCAQYDAVCDSEERLRVELAEANKRIEELSHEVERLENQLVEVRDKQFRAEGVRDQLRAELAEWKRTSQEGHQYPCTLGPLCPYCEIERKDNRIEELERKIRLMIRALEGGE